MHFLLIAYDGTDEHALERRMKFRDEHLKKIRELKKSGNFIYGGAILNDEGKMIGSSVLFEFPDRQALDENLKEEPYIIGGVWHKIEIRPFRLAKME
jgi:hypothetical protein